jgi:tRNA(Ile)-lysidine synthase
LQTHLLNLMRGTGWKGWAGIPVRNGPFIRPLIEVDRATVEAYARQHAIPFREDRSNRDPKYLRNRVRHELLPMMEALRPGAHPTARRSMGLLRSLVRFADVGMRARIGVPLREGGSIDPQLLRDTGALGIAWALQGLDVHPETQERMLRAVEAGDHGERFKAGGGTIWIERDRLVFRADATAMGAITVSGPEEALAAGFVVERFAADRWDRKPDPASAWLDAAKAPFPWVVRPWCNGDRMRPLGLGGGKLISDLLTDAKVDRSSRAQVRVIESAGRIIWLVGHRIDESVAITAATTEVFRIGSAIA